MSARLLDVSISLQPHCLKALHGMVILEGIEEELRLVRVQRGRFLVLRQLFLARLPQQPNDSATGHSPFLQPADIISK